MRLFLCFTLILYAGERAQGCEVVFSPKNVFVEFGGSVTVNCNTSSCNNMVGIGWESPFGGTGLKEGVSSLDLKIDVVNDWNAEPKCYVVFSDDTQKIEKLPFTVYKLPKTVSMPKPTNPMKATGEKYSLQCDVVGVAPANKVVLSLYKGNESILKMKLNDSSRSPVDKSVQTPVQVVAEDNGKQVWCEAKLDFLPAEQGPPPTRSESHVLTVLYPPIFTDPKNESLEIPIGTKRSFNCTATGNPPPDYSWNFTKHMQEEIQKQTEIGPNLTLDFRVSGELSCTASNIVGERTRYFHLKKLQGNQTTLAVILGVCLTLGAVIFIAGLVFVTQKGTCSFPKGSYQPTASGAI